MELTKEQEREIERAVAILESGGIVAFPTETVYGLGADADNEAAVGKVFAAKQRPTWHPLIVHLPDAESISWWADNAACCSAPRGKILAGPSHHGGSPGRTLRLMGHRRSEKRRPPVPFPSAWTCPL